MTREEPLLSGLEQTVFRLRGLYQSYGYLQYQMSKFEEYDLYAQNKDFLVSDNVITFMDGGKLMALKPDVTLSIVRAIRPGSEGLEKVFYDENVYRVAKGMSYFQEIRQTGLECIGPVDDYDVAEVVLLAAESLRAISPRSVLVLSHLGAVSKALDRTKVSAEARESLLKCISSKSLQGLERVCAQSGADPEGAGLLRDLLSVSGENAAILDALSRHECLYEELHALRALLSAMDAAGLGGMLRLDFSVLSDMNYYGGMVFQGFVSGVPGSVLSGGQYDKLIAKLGRKGGAIGFAVYLDQLERLFPEEGNDADLVLLYDEIAAAETVLRAVRELTAQGLRVRVARQVPEELRYGKLAKLVGSEVQILG